MPRAILQISRDLTPKSCSILLKAPGWGYQLPGLNGGRTTRSLCQHQCGRGNLVTSEKPGKTRNGAGRRVLVALRRERPWESHRGSKEKLIWDLFPHHLTASTAWWCSSGCRSRAKQGKLFLEEFLLPKQNSPPLITPRWNGKATESREPGLCFGLTCRCDLAFP